MLNHLSFNRATCFLFLLSRKVRLVILAALFVCCYASPVYSALPTIVANSSVQVEQLSLRELRAIFTMKKRFWSDGQPIAVFVYSEDNPIHKDFCKKQLSVFPRQLEAVWYRLVYTGTGQAPIKVSSEREMLEKVSNTPGAIGYVEKINDDKKTKILGIH